MSFSVLFLFHLKKLSHSVSIDVMPQKQSRLNLCTRFWEIFGSKCCSREHHLGPVNLIGGVERLGSYTISQVVEIIRFCPTVVPFTVEFTLPTSSQVTPNSSAYSSRIPESDTRKKNEVPDQAFEAWWHHPILGSVWWMTGVVFDNMQTFSPKWT